MVDMGKRRAAPMDTAREKEQMAKLTLYTTSSSGENGKKKSSSLSRLFL